MKFTFFVKLTAFIDEVQLLLAMFTILLAKFTTLLAIFNFYWKFLHFIGELEKITCFFQFARRYS
ncbi:hypothetical protein DYI25_20545 [Mesobacillus boroniphilus]|uniref:Uncharacterized protein n=1 Tax=Mesobacillus boroniphilus TaxID=308892 RepID=A0A944CQ20_9BACI|nr:hypothetical protein [Mesobacillus boroniphilus]